MGGGCTAATVSKPPTRWVQRAQIGPHAKAWAAWMHWSLGIPFAKIARFVTDRVGLTVTAGALCQAGQTTSTALVPVTIRSASGSTPPPWS